MTSQFAATAMTVLAAAGIFWCLWPRLDAVSRGLVGMFAVVSVISISNGTWTQNHRTLRRQARDDRREAYRQIHSWVRGKSKQI
jgi:uncharacterized membrane protein YhhN|mmetsp:Transcript_65780/g.146836  ORF Transcript_65780/g.146836 Transcript_65780/m.146836 type:complete len:84 (-) Transcript_65780:849-1100(-)